MAQDLEQKARSSASVEHDLSHSEAHVRGYLAGAAEAMRWRDPKVEPPPREKLFQVLLPVGYVDTYDDDPMARLELGVEAWVFREPYYQKHLDGMLRDGVLWREIGPLPTTTDCKSEVGS